MKFLLTICAVVLAVSCCVAHGAKAHRELERLGLRTVRQHPTSQPVREYGPNDWVNGVSPECRQLWMRKTMVVQFNGQQTRCPRGAFGAILVNHTAIGPFTDSRGNNCGNYVGTNSGTRDTGNDPTAHSEIGAIRRLAAQYPGVNIGFNKEFWNDLSMYTNGESCPMDAAAEAWAGIKEEIYAVSIDHLIALNFTQIDLISKDIFKKSGIIPYAPETIISHVDFDYHAKYFSWQNMPEQACPPGCHRSGAMCIDDVPFVPIVRAACSCRPC